MPILRLTCSFFQYWATMPFQLAKRPKTSMNVPSNNQGDYLKQALQSVLNHGCPETELIVVDGGSTDSSPEAIRRYGSNDQPSPARQPVSRHQR